MARVSEAWSTVESLAEDSELGAAEIAERAARALPSVPPEDLADALETLIRGHPQMGPLWRLAHESISEGNSAGAERFLSQLASDGDAVNVLVPLLPDRLLTISYSSTVKEAIHRRRPRVVHCMSSHPGGEGLQMAGALAAFAEVEVVEDDEALANVAAEAVVIGADAVTPTSLVNKVKTRALAEAAQARGVPCFAIVGETKFVPEELPVNGPFEATGLEQFTGIATPMGLLTPSEAASYASGVPMHEALRSLITRL